MKKVLNSFLFYLIIGIILSIFAILKVYIIKYKSVYQDKVYTLTGKVSKVILSEKKVSFVLKEKENIQMFYYDDFDLNEGDKVTVNVLLSTPKKNTIPNTFNYQKYLYNNGIYKVGTVNKIEIIKKNNNILNNLKSSLSKKVSFNPYLKLFILGDKKDIDESYNYYKDIGVAHLLAISGMHVGVFVSIMRKILFFLSKKSQNKFISIVLLFYAFITGFSASILRVVVFFIINSINKDYDFKYNGLKKTNNIAIGIDIPDKSMRGKGIGVKAIKEYLKYFKKLGYFKIYTQTWSGNTRMIHVAEKIGFKEINRYKEIRNVNGKKYDALTFVIDL